jgi:AcrR family transcriptional regulator
MTLHERRIRERERRRQQIIAASKKVFLAKGVAEATIKDIAAAAELSPGTLYIYFKNKDELYSSISIRVLKHLSLRLQRVKETRDITHEERVQAIKEALLEAYEIDPPVFIALSHLQASETLDNISLELLDQIMGLSRQSLETLAAIFAEAMRVGEVQSFDPQRLAMVLWALFSGLVLWEESKRSLNPEKNFLKPTLDMAFEIFSHGIMKRTADADPSD